MSNLPADETNQPPTELEMRKRTTEIALEAYVDTSDESEPLEQLIPRVRAGLEQELQNITELFQDFDAELGEFEDILAAQETSQIEGRS